ncbi:butyrophilin subfamily 1 member A1-like [Siphateles boraxobius]|uniref:butyrophilin subfamily 1 member A1-like n=1 Tax=Siphateles boraxobius TaxID=180520 RepID=UPI004062D978
MKFICLTLLLVIGITDSRSEQYKVVGPAVPVFAVAGEDVILPCFTKPSISVVDMRVEWLRVDQKDSVHLYDDHEDRNTDQTQSYRGRTKLIHQELQRGNASLKLSTVRVSDEGSYKCFIQSKFWFDEATFNVSVEAVGRPPVITVDGLDGSGGLHLQCESEGWYPEPDLEWLDSEGVSLSSETKETHRNTDGFSVKHTITVYDSNNKIHCRVKLRHHMLESLINTTNNVFDSGRTSLILISVIVVLVVIAGILIAVFTYKNRGHDQLQDEKNRNIQDEKSRIQHDFSIFSAVKVTLDADSAHPQLIVSHDGKQVECGNRQNAGKDRFNYQLGVLGKDGFSSGSFYFEVQVKDQTEWDVGVARESVNRKSWFGQKPDGGYWTVSRRDKWYWVLDSSDISLCPRVEPQRVRVFVDYEEGHVSFYDVESMYHIYSYTSQSFNEKLFPFVCLGDWKNENSTPLIICDDTNDVSE